MNLIIIALAATISASSALENSGGKASDDSRLVRPIGESNPHGAAEGGFPLGGARVIVVSSLKSDGEGSLRAALREPGPRLVVFEVGGVIDLGGVSLNVEEPMLFIAGESAPAPGITLIRGGLVIEAHHVVVRHIAIRPGDGRVRSDRPWEPDGITIVRDEGPVHDVLIENCSATWAVDENASISGPRDIRPSDGPEATAHRVVFRNNLIAEALLNSTHAKGAHSMGLLVHDGIREVVLEGNLFAHNRERNPRLKGGVEAVIQGNVIYNWGSAAIGMGARGNRENLDGARAVIRNNVALAGPDSTRRLMVRSVDPGAEVEALNNLARDFKGGDLPLLDAGLGPLKAPLAGMPSTKATPSAAAILDSVLRGAGSRPAQRDPVDRRIVTTVIEGTGRIIDSQSQVGGYPERPVTRRAVVVPGTGAEREAWLRERMKDLAVDSTLDLKPLLNRLNLPR